MTPTLLTSSVMNNILNNKVLGVNNKVRMCEFPEKKQNKQTKYEYN